MSDAMTEVSMTRLYALRVYYVLIAAGLALMIGPLILLQEPNVEHARSVVRALLGAVGLLAALGVRYPLRMMPILLFEFAWKTIWLLAFALPASRQGPLDATWQSSVFDTGLGVVASLLIIPWPWVWQNYVRRPGDPWRAVGSR